MAKEASPPTEPTPLLCRDQPVFLELVPVAGTHYRSNSRRVRRWVGLSGRLKVAARA